MGDSNETQDKIIKSAIRVFAEKGYNGAKTAEIARDAGVAEGTVFKYFSTKKVLLNNVLDKIVHDLIPGIAEGSPEQIIKECLTGDPKQIVKREILSRIRKINENISCFKILVNEIQYHEDFKNDYFNKFIPSLVNMFENIYNAGIKLGVFRELNPHVAIRSFVGMLALMVIEINVLGKQIDMDEELDIIMDIYLNGVGKKEV